MHHKSRKINIFLIKSREKTFQQLVITTYQNCINYKCNALKNEVYIETSIMKCELVMCALDEIVLYTVRNLKYKIFNLIFCIIWYLNILLNFFKFIFSFFFLFSGLKIYDKTAHDFFHR